MKSQIPGSHVGAVRTLLFVVDAASLTVAGRRLGLTPSAVSRQISRLEESLGARLLERTTRSVRATAAGLALCERTRPLFEAFEEAESAVRELQAEIRGRVRISASPAFGRACLVPLLGRLSAEHPGLEFDVMLSARRADFVEDEIDLAVREGTLRDSSLTARRIGTAEAILCASPGYLARHGRPRVLDDLEQHTLLVVPASGPSSDLSRLRGRDGRKLRLDPRFRVNDLFALKGLAEDGVGIAALPDYVAREALAAGSLVRLLPRATLASLPVHVVYPSRRHLPRRVRVVIDSLAAESGLAS